MDKVDKTVYKIGEMVIDNKQIFWKMKYCYALIPIVQLLDGRIAAPIQMCSSHPNAKSQNSPSSNQLRCST